MSDERMSDLAMCEWGVREVREEGNEKERRKKRKNEKKDEVKKKPEEGKKEPGGWREEKKKKNGKYEEDEVDLQQCYMEKRSEIEGKERKRKE